MSEPTAEQADRDPLDEMREHLASVSAGDVVAEAALSLVALAYVRLGIPPEQNERYRDLDAARLLIDALAGMLDGVRGRLGAPEPELRDVLTSLRMAYVDVASHTGAEHPAGPAPAGEPPPAAAEEPGPGRSRPSGLWVPGQD
jgi:Domain of unknown function (DUF1844)